MADLTNLRYWQAAIDITAECPIEGFNIPGPQPERIIERVLFTPDVTHHLCSPEKMLWCTRLDYAAWWPEDTEVPEEFLEAWDSALMDVQHGDSSFGDYYGYNDCVKEWGLESPEQVVFTDMFVKVEYQDVYEDNKDGQQQAEEDAHANHRV